MEEPTVVRPRGQAINARRARCRVRALGITVTELGIRLGISRSGASNILNGRQRLSPDRLQRLAHALELEDPSDLLA